MNKNIMHLAIFCSATALCCVVDGIAGGTPINSFGNNFTPPNSPGGKTPNPDQSKKLNSAGIAGGTQIDTFDNNFTPPNLPGGNTPNPDQSKKWNSAGIAGGTQIDNFNNNFTPSNLPGGNTPNPDQSEQWNSAGIAGGTPIDNFNNNFTSPNLPGGNTPNPDQSEQWNSAGTSIQANECNDTQRQFIKFMVDKKSSTSNNKVNAQKDLPLPIQAQFFIDNTSEEEVFQALENAARNGNVAAQRMLIKWYLRGTYVPQDINYARLYCREAAKNGDAFARCILNSLDDLWAYLNQGRSTSPTDLENVRARVNNVVSQLCSTANGPNASSEDCLGAARFLLLLGEWQNARPHLQRAADAGDVSAQRLFAIFNMKGKWGNQDLELAARYFRWAASNGDPFSIAILENWLFVVRNLPKLVGPKCK
ncbi:MAG: sel1 repeat family protein [Holosporales bacterium]|jgi:TPR repeat protein|nr:sel1 repeat family protein [Holosporales bacterium]